MPWDICCSGNGSNNTFLSKMDSKQEREVKVWILTPPSLLEFYPFASSFPSTIRILPKLYKHDIWSSHNARKCQSFPHLTTHWDSAYAPPEERGSYSPVWFADLFLLPWHQISLCHHLCFLPDSSLLDCLFDDYQPNWQVNQPITYKLITTIKIEIFGGKRKIITIITYYHKG